MESFREKKIVVPWDFSEMSYDALDKAMEIASSPEQVEVVHVTSYPSVVEPSVVWGTYSEDSIRVKLEESFQGSEAAKKYPGLHFVAIFGDPGTVITEHAENIGAGLIVISSHGRTGVPRFLLGSVAERVVRLAPCPVLVLRS